jgi:hypothetical protein
MTDEMQGFERASNPDLSPWPINQLEKPTIHSRNRMLARYDRISLGIFHRENPHSEGDFLVISTEREGTDERRHVKTGTFGLQGVALGKGRAPVIIEIGRLAPLRWRNGD